MKHRRLIVVITVVLSIAALTGCRSGASQSSESLHLLDNRSAVVEPLRFDDDAKAVVFLFTREDCPISNRYAPEVRRLYEQFAPQGVRFWLVYPDPEITLEIIATHIEEFGYPFGALRDPKHELVKKTGATITPEAAVFIADGTMVYRGRIDDRFVDYGKARVAPSSRELHDALQAVVEGQPVPVATAPAVGCLIDDLR